MDAGNPPKLRNIPEKLRSGPSPRAYRWDPSLFVLARVWLTSALGGWRREPKRFRNRKDSPAQHIFPMTRTALETALTSYATLELAWKHFGRDPAELKAEEVLKLSKLVEQRLAREASMLASPEAASAVPTEAAVQDALKELSAQFKSAEEHEAALAAQGMHLEDLPEIVRWNLHVKSTLDYVGSLAPRPTDEELRRTYHAEIHRVMLPERRRTSHILLIVPSQESAAEHQAAEAKLTKLKGELDQHPELWGEMVIKHSECPSALNGGLLGDVPPGKAYPEIDAVLFKMAEGSISGPIQTGIGWHLVKCVTILPAGPAPFEELRDKLEERMAVVLRLNHTKAWLAQLNSLPLA